MARMVWIRHKPSAMGAASELSWDLSPSLLAQDMRVSKRNEKIGLDLSQHDEVYGGETGIAEDPMSLQDWYRNME